MFSTSLVTTTQATSTVSTVVQQLVADLPTLLAVLAGIAAIYFITDLVKQFIHGATTTYGSVGGSSDSDRKWKQFVDSNERVIRRAREASAESDRLMKKTRSEW